MAIDPNIPLMGIRSNVDYGQSLLQGLQIAQAIGGIKRQRRQDVLAEEEAKRAAELQPMRERLLKSRLAESETGVQATQAKLAAIEEQNRFFDEYGAINKVSNLIQSKDANSTKSLINKYFADAPEGQYLNAAIDANRWDIASQFVNQAKTSMDELGVSRGWIKEPKQEKYKLQRMTDQSTGREVMARVNEQTGEVIGTVEGFGPPAKDQNISIKQGTDPITGQPGYYKFSNGQLIGKVEGINPPAKTGIVVGPDGTVTIGAPMASSNVAKAQEKVTTAIDNLARLKDIRSSFDPQFLTFIGQGRQAFLRTKERAGASLSPDEKQYVGQYRQFSEGVDQFFNQYRKDITGAAAAVAELSSLKDAILNKDLSPTEFTSSFDRLVNEATRTINIQNSLIDQGLSPSSKAFQQQADQLFMSGRNKNFMQRGSELEKQGLNDDQIKQQLRLEGYSIR